MLVAAQDVPVSIAQFATAQRRANAQRILVTLLALRAITVPLSWALSAPPHVPVIQGISTLALAFAYWLHRRGRDDAGPGLLLFSELAQHVALVAVSHNLGAIPYLAPVLVLIGAAMLNLRRLPWVLALSLCALVAEGLLANWTPDAPGALVTSVILTLVVFVVSRLHVGGTDRALALADAREAARAVERQIVFPQGLNLNQQLQALQPLLQRLVGSKVTLELVGSETSGSVLMDASHLEQVLMNLAVNARDAMPNGGTLRYTLTYRDVLSAEPGLGVGLYAQIAVTDTGTGISPELLPRLFDPFFTTKGEQGTGLGLATCHSIVTGLGGSVFVDSTLGNGTTFRVLLPVASTGASIRQAVAAKSFGQVLVVDDELAVRETTARMLRASGYHVVTAGSIEQARGILNDTSVACDALLTDVVLHNERGFELLADCRRLRPDARIVVMSGFAPEPEAAVALQESAAGFLPKPFTIDELCAALRD